MIKNKKTVIVGSVAILVSLLISLFAMIPINKKVDVDPWMKKVSDDKLITTMSIPGTHDSGATHSIFDVAGKCQDINIKTQLNIGVRFFDIRLQQVNDNFNVVHSFVDQRTKFEKVLDDMASFVKKYPSEFLLVSIKEDASSKNSIRAFEDVLLENLNKHKDVISYDTTLPNTLKEARGKIFILSRYSSTIGIDAYIGWQDDASFAFNNLYVQDNYYIDNVNDKIDDIQNTLNIAKTNKDKLILNFTSCYLSYGFPPTYSVPPAKKINPWFIKQVSQNTDSLGIIVADFITYEMANVIYRRNY